MKPTEATTETSQEIPLEFQALDESLRCPMCGDHYNAAVAVGDRECGHSFCSECIRNKFREGLKGLKRQATCPICRFLVRASNPGSVLVPNRGLQEAVFAWREFMKQWKGRRPSIASQGVATPSPLGNRSSARQRDRKLKYSDESEFVEQVESPSRQPVMERRPTQVYTRLKKKRLQELKDGLTSNGTEEQLKTRHQAFITLWNAELDSLHPRTPKELAEVVTSRERQKNKENIFGMQQTDCIKHIITRGSSGDPDFDRRWKEGFVELLDQLKERMGAEAFYKARGSRARDPHPSDSSSPSNTVQTTNTNNIEATEAINSFSSSGESLSKQLDSEQQIAESNTSESSVRKIPGSVTPGKEVDSSAGQPVYESGDMGRAAKPNLSQKTLHFQRKQPLPSGLRETGPCSKRMRQTITGPWSCGTCTYFNEKRTYSTAKCEICSAPRTSKG